MSSHLIFVSTLAFIMAWGCTHALSANTTTTSVTSNIKLIPAQTPSTAPPTSSFRSSRPPNSNPISGRVWFRQLLQSLGHLRTTLNSAKKSGTPPPSSPSSPAIPVPVTAVKAKVTYEKRVPLPMVKNSINLITSKAPAVRVSGMTHDVMNKLMMGRAFSQLLSRLQNTRALKRRLEYNLWQRLQIQRGVSPDTPTSRRGAQNIAGSIPIRTPVSAPFAKSHLSSTHAQSGYGNKSLSRKLTQMMKEKFIASQRAAAELSLFGTFARSQANQDKLNSFQRSKMRIQSRAHTQTEPNAQTQPHKKVIYIFKK